MMLHKEELSTTEAARFLNVSLPFVIKEMKEGRLPYRKVGSHRKLSFVDLKVYGHEMRGRQVSALDRMAENARELGLDY